MTDYHICLKTWVGIFRVGIFGGQIHQGGILGENFQSGSFRGGGGGVGSFPNTILSLLKIVPLKFTMYILKILTFSLKLYVIRKYIFLQPRFFFNSHFQGGFSLQ